MKTNCLGDYEILFPFIAVEHVINTKQILHFYFSDRFKIPEELDTHVLLPFILLFEIEALP